MNAGVAIHPVKPRVSIVFTTPLSAGENLCAAPHIGAAVLVVVDLSCDF